MENVQYQIQQRRAWHIHSWKRFFQKDGYYVAEQELEELGIELDAEEEVLLKKEQLLALWERLEETKEEIKEKIEDLEAISLEV